MKEEGMMYVADGKMTAMEEGEEVEIMPGLVMVFKNGQMVAKVVDEEEEE